MTAHGYTGVINSLNEGGDSGRIGLLEDLAPSLFVLFV